MGIFCAGILIRNENGQKNPTIFIFIFFLLENGIGIVDSKTVTISVILVHQKQDGGTEYTNIGRKSKSHVRISGVWHSTHLIMYEDDFFNFIFASSHST